MATRLSKTDEDYIRRKVDGGEYSFFPREAIIALLAELDTVRAEREQLGKEVAGWLRSLNVIVSVNRHWKVRISEKAAHALAAAFETAWYWRCRKGERLECNELFESERKADPQAMPEAP
jgi:hypothetical protein